MLDTETKRRIDTARDILVGKVPDPKSQVEQITIALIYKFMDDMDLESEELGGERSFFKGDFEKYSWRRIFDPRMGGFEILNLYSEAIMKMNVNPNIPQLFRDIFKNAYLPYRDPETLKVFLKVINDFTYDHSEKLGDAFEYLLSVLGSQGEAGQFRTPRHIIDFMVEIIDPKKDETILDPACGTAGFLISSYKHIIKHNSSNYDPKEETKTFEVKDVHLDELTINSKKYSGDKLTPDERSRLAKNIKGYDISPDMVRLSLVNMYLHGLHSPLIHEYDTLTSEDKWNEYADVILANPPFMSPKGGIRPHKRFSITSSRSEVLFVDYIAEHLTPNGRAVVIVPEGIIFQSGTAYKNLRKMLVENYLVGVISLPAGVFHPYSGVKTSILWLDKTLAKKTDKILFVKIENDGFDLGAQRRPIKQNDLPKSIEEIKLLQGSINDHNINLADNLSNSFQVPRTKILENSDYSFSGERYRERHLYTSDFPIVNLSEIADIIAGQSPNGKYYNDEGNGLPFYQGKTEFGEIYIGQPTKWTTEITKEAQREDILMSVRAPVGPVNIATERICIGRGLAAIRTKENSLPFFIFYFLQSIQDKLVGSGGSVFDNISKKQIEQIQIPLPPLSVQEEIVAEIESYQKIIDGARQVVENYKLRIDIDPEWPLVELGEVCSDFINGVNFSKEQVGSGTKFVNIKDLFSDGYVDVKKLDLVQLSDKEIERHKLSNKDILFVRSSVKYEGVGFPSLFLYKDDNPVVFCGFIIKASPNKDAVIPEYLLFLLRTDQFRKQVIGLSNRANITNISQSNLKSLRIPLPSVPIQKEIVNRIESERAMISMSKELVELFEQKIKVRIAKVWGSEI